MIIYKQEITDGLDAILSTQASICYASIAEPCEFKESFNKQNIKSIAALNDSDLYYLQSILVSSSWNKNDDIFDKAEIWLAKNTPEDKPTNLEHDEAAIIGHITSNYPVSDDGKIIDPETPIDSLPDKFHILTGSVIYKGFTSPDLKERAYKLISEIENGTKYVSMECFFKDFDYGLINQSTGAYKILQRNDNTSYLTKYLRAYGGTGQHGEYKLGRVLRNITFSGKGFVDKPANQDSIIFSRTTLNNFISTKSSLSEKEGVLENKSFLKSETNTMNLEEVVEQINTKLDSVLTAQSFKDTYSKACELESKVSELESSVQAQMTEQEKMMKEKEDMLKEKEQMMKDKEMAMLEMDKMKAEIAAMNEQLNQYKSKEAEMLMKEMNMKRMASLIEIGVDSEQASSITETMASLNDDQFSAVVATIKKTKDVAPVSQASETQPVEDSANESASAETVVDPSTLDDVEVEQEVSLAVSDSEGDTGIQSTRAALIDFVKSRLQTSN